MVVSRNALLKKKKQEKVAKENSVLIFISYFSLYFEIFLELPSTLDKLPSTLDILLSTLDIVLSTLDSRHLDTLTL